MPSNSDPATKKLKRSHDEAGEEDSKITQTKGPSHDKKGSTDSEHDTTTCLEDENGRIEREGQSWRKEPPYCPPTDEERREAKYVGACNCGRIRYHLTRDKPVASKFCHCTDCQSLHGTRFPHLFGELLLMTLVLGAPLQWAAIFHKEDLHFEDGATGLAFYHSGKKHTRHELPTKVSCAFCHAPIMDEGRNMVLMFPALIKFPSEEDKEGFYPT